jgi:hypothetical protein
VELCPFNNLFRGFYRGNLLPSVASLWKYFAFRSLTVEIFATVASLWKSLFRFVASPWKQYLCYLKYRIIDQIIYFQAILPRTYAQISTEI